MPPDQEVLVQAVFGAVKVELEKLPGLVLTDPVAEDTWAGLLLGAGEARKIASGAEPPGDDHLEQVVRLRVGRELQAAYDGRPYPPRESLLVRLNHLGITP